MFTNSQCFGHGSFSIVIYVLFGLCFGQIKLIDNSTMEEELD